MAPFKHNDFTIGANWRKGARDAAINCKRDPALILTLRDVHGRMIGLCTASGFEASYARDNIMRRNTRFLALLLSDRDLYLDTSADRQEYMNYLRSIGRRRRDYQQQIGG